MERPSFERHHEAEREQALKLMEGLGVEIRESMLLQGIRTDIEQARDPDRPERRQYGAVPYFDRREDIIRDFPNELNYFSGFRERHDATPASAKYAEATELFAMKWGRPMREFAEEILVHYPDLGKKGQDVCLFGLSGAGKTEITRVLGARLGDTAVVMDSDTVRYNLFGRMVRDVETGAGASLEEVRQHLLFNRVSDCLYLLRQHVAGELKNRGYTVIQNATTPRFTSDRLIYIENPDEPDPTTLAEADLPAFAERLSSRVSGRTSERDDFDWEHAETVTDFRQMRPVQVRVSAAANESILKELRRVLSKQDGNVTHVMNRRTEDGRGLAAAADQLEELLRA